MSPVASRRFFRLLLRCAVLLAAGATCFTAKPGPPPPGLLWVADGARNIERHAYIDGTGRVVHDLDVDPEHDAYTPELRERLSARGFRPRPWAWRPPASPTSFETGWVSPTGGCGSAVRPDDPPPPVSRQWRGEWADAAGNIVEYHVRAQGRHGRVHATYMPAAVVAEVQAKLAADASMPTMDPPQGSRRY